MRSPVALIPVSLAAYFLCPGPLAAEEGNVTFNRQIAPIIYQNCAPCHRPGEAAPFPLLSYENVVKKGKAIAKITAARFMPPWQPEAASFAYRDERRLKEADIALIQKWVADGMPEGAAAEKPPAPQFPSGWRLGEPDLVVEMPAAYHVPAGGPDIYRNIAVSLGLGEEKWLTAIDMRPSARAVVHHVLYFADPAGHAHERNKAGEEPGFSGMRPGGAAVPLGGWAVGAQPHFFPEGLALRVPKGADLVIQYHFHPSGKPEAEKSLIGLYFAKEAPKRTLTRIQMPPDYALFSGLNIPAGEKDFVIRDSYTLPRNIEAVGVGAHAHYLARAMKMTATFPGGDVKTLLNIQDWDFAWQDRYFFQEFQKLPQGTRLDVEIHWDNSAANPRNPSHPPIPVEWGEQTKDEMGSISLMAVPGSEADLRPLQASLNRRRNDLAREKMQTDPDLARKVARLLAQ